MERELGLVALFNDHLAGVANAILGVFNITAKNPARPWEAWIVMEILVAVLLMILVALLKAKLSPDKPGALQHIFELFYGFINKTASEGGIHHTHEYVPYIGTIAIFILSMNLIGIIPSFESPTMSPWVPAGLAIVTFFYFNIMGFKVHGIKYLAHFAGPVRFSNPLATAAIICFLVPIELISMFIRPLSLTVRLFGNIFAGEQVTLVFLDLTKFLFPVIFMGLHIFVGLVQAYVFTLLTTIYIAMATSEEH
jgi:F-type H+-transporting ATPase subunit a